MSDPATVSLKRPGTWPRSARLALEAIVTVMANAYMMARSRAAGSPSKTVRLMAEIDDLKWRNALLERELTAQRCRLASMDPARRPHFLPENRIQLLLLIRLWGWSVKQAAQRLVLHRNTLANWRRRFFGSKDPDGFFGDPPFNRLGDSVRWLVHEMHELGVRFGDGTRTIAARICRAGIRLSRSSVQRILREPKPRRARRALVPPTGEEPRHILRPEHTNRTWHLDLAVVTRLGRRFHVAALLDGYSRRLLALKAYARTPTSIMMLALVRRAIGEFGKPRFLVCDHGCQFRTWFRERLEQKLGITPVSGKVRSPTFNGKAERFFRTLKDWTRGLLIAVFADKIRTARWLQRRLDTYRDWFNGVRVHQGLGGRTPEEAWSGAPALEPRPVRVRDPRPQISVTRRAFRGNHRLPVFEIDVRWPEAA